MSQSAFFLLALFAALTFVRAETVAQEVVLPSPSVGLAAEVEGIFLPGSELEPAPLDETGIPIVLRILERYPHGMAGFRYDLEFYGLDHGEFDLSHYLVRADGSPLGDAELPELLVNVLPSLPEGPPGLLNTLPEPDTPRTGGYRSRLLLLGLLWIGGLVMLLLFRRPKLEIVEQEPSSPTLSDRLRPLAERAINGNLDPTGQAELERLLLGFWREKLHLSDLPVAVGLERLRQDEEGGEMLRQVEQWLHRPVEDREAINVETLLLPYRSAAENVL